MEPQDCRSWKYISLCWKKENKSYAFETFEELLYLIKNNNMQEACDVLFDHNEYLLYALFENTYDTETTDAEYIPNNHRLSIREAPPHFESPTPQNNITIPSESIEPFTRAFLYHLLSTHDEELPSIWDKLLFQAVSQPEYFTTFSEEIQQKILRHTLRECYIPSGFSWRKIYNDTPEHRVYIPHDLFVMAYPVCNQLYHQILTKHPWKNHSKPNIKKPLHPVINIRWLDCIYFANALSKEMGYEEAYIIDDESEEVHWNEHSSGFRLLTEAEWWHSMSCGDYRDIEAMKEHMGYFVLPSMRPKLFPIGQKSPNVNGICDFYGHIREWIWDRHCEIYSYIKHNFPQIKRDYQQFLTKTLIAEGYTPSDIPNQIDKYIKKFDDSVVDQERLDHRLFLTNPTGSTIKSRPRIRIGWNERGSNNEEIVFGWRMKKPISERKPAGLTGFRLVRTRIT